MELTEQARKEEVKQYAVITLEDIFFNLNEENKILKNDFAKGTKYKDLSIGNSIVIKHEKHKIYARNSIEAKTKLYHNARGEIGYFSIIWNNSDVIVDTFYVLY